MERFFEIEPLVGLDTDNNPVSNYSDAIYFDVTNEGEENIICWGIYERTPEIGDARHIADFPTKDNAERMLHYLGKKIQNG